MEGSCATSPQPCHQASSLLTPPGSPVSMCQAGCIITHQFADYVACMLCRESNREGLPGMYMTVLDSFKGEIACSLQVS